MSLPNAPTRKVIGFDLDTSKAQAKLNKLSNQSTQIDQSIDAVSTKIRMVWMQSQMILNMILQSQKDTAVGQVLLTGQQVAMAAQSIYMTGVEAASAFASGNIASGAILSANVAALTIAEGMALNNQIQAEQNKRQIEAYQAATLQFKGMYS